MYPEAPVTRQRTGDDMLSSITPGRRGDHDRGGLQPGPRPSCPHVESIARDRKMAGRDVAQAQAQDEAFRSYVQEAAYGNDTADELTKLADLRDHGAISEADFRQGKEKILRTAA